MRNVLFILVLFFCLAGQAGAYQEESPPVEITIVQKDYLINVCKRYLEHPNEWRKIARLNHLADPDLLLPGQTLKIPLGMLKGIPANGTVSFSKGEVTVRRTAQEQWQALNLHDVVPMGSDIRTGTASAVEISFEDGTALLMRANTALKVITSKKGLSYLLRNVYLQSGKLISKIKSATGRDTRYEIQTPSSLAAARGTEFSVSVDDRQATRAEVQEGIVDVSAMAQTVALHKDEGTLVRMNAPPTQPGKLLSPPEAIGLAPLYRAMPLTVQFSKVKGAATYNVVLAKDRAARNIVAEKTIKPDENFEISDLDDGAYYVLCHSVDGNGLEGQPSTSAEVLVKRQPSPPHVDSPTADATLRTRSVQFAWAKDQGTAGYHLQIAPDREFRTMVVDVATIRGCAFNARDLNYGEYHYRVRSVAEDGFAGEWSAVRHFRVLAPPPAPKIEITEITGQGAHLRWDNPGEGITYQVQVAADENFQNILLDKKVDQPEIILASPEKGRKNYVRVRGIDQGNYAGEYSSALNFAPKTRFPLELLGLIGVIFLIAL